MKRTVVTFLAATGAAVFVLSAAPARALGPGSPGPDPKPAVQAPDLAFKEVQVFYPAFNRGFRIVPPDGPLRLIEDPGAAPGTRLGPDEPNGQPGPIVTRSCREPLRASLRIGVANFGAGPFDATTDALGLTGSVAGQAVKSAFGKVAAGQTVSVEAGALSLVPGSHPVVLTLNAAHGGGEQNYNNNKLETRLEITCDCPRGQVREAATGRCMAPPQAATVTPTPKGLSPAGGANRSANAGLPPAAMAAAPPRPPAPTPRSLGGLTKSSGVLQCIVGGVSQRYIASVNTTKNGVTFTPGRTYEIAGCGFGAAAGQVYLGAYISGQGDKKIPLSVIQWGEQRVMVQPDESLNSLPDVGSVSLNLIPSGEPESRAIGFTAGLNRFETEKETRWVRPETGYARPSWAWGHPVVGIDSSGERAMVTRNLKGSSTCPPISTPTDDWDVRRLLDLGFKILNVDFVNQTDKKVGDNDSAQEVVVGSTGEARFVPSAKVVRVWWEGHSTYYKALEMSTVGGTSVCTSSYAIRLQVQGPKGVNPFPP